jgi:uncharacterized protein YcaQ
MGKQKVSLALARRIALNAQLLAGGTELPRGKEGVAQAVERLGYVQIDTIAVVQRAHHHTLWARRSDYDPEMLHKLQAQDRRLFEYWGHAASYLPMSDYRYYLPRMRSFHHPKSKWEQKRLKEHGHLMEPVLERIREEGPLASRDFKPPPGRQRGAWWDWKPSKIALEMLFWRGDLMVTERRNFQRVYDLTERVLPDHVDTSFPDEGELGRFLVRRALSAYGVASEREIGDHIHAASRDVITDALADLLDAREVERVEIEGGNGADDFALAGTVEAGRQLEQVSPRVLLLSPFDNLVIQRQRLQRLFGFDYSLECYTPAAKRKYGYFSLPILWGDAFVGRLDPKADRKTRTLVLRNLIFEPEFEVRDDFLLHFADACVAFADFNGCETSSVEDVQPDNVRAALEGSLMRVGL